MAECCSATKQHNFAIIIFPYTFSCLKTQNCINKVRGWYCAKPSELLPTWCKQPSVGRQPTESNMGQTKKFKIQRWGEGDTWGDSGAGTNISIRLILIFNNNVLPYSLFEAIYHKNTLICWLSYLSQKLCR